MNDKVRTINIEGIEVQTSLTPVELADLLQKYAELQSNWNSLREWLEDLSKGKLINGEYTQLVGIRIEYVLDKMNKLEGKDNNE